MTEPRDERMRLAAKALIDVRPDWLDELAETYDTVDYTELAAVVVTVISDVLAALDDADAGLAGSYVVEL